MPRSKYYGKRKPKRRYKRKYALKRNIHGMSSGFPKTRTVSLRYCELGSITSTLGILEGYPFRANSIFDPRANTGGHQPMGYDTWASLYNHYVVLGAKITVLVGAANGADNGQFTIYTSDDLVIPYTDSTGFIEAKRGSTKMITNARNQVKLTSTFSAKKFFNITDVKDNFDRVGSTVGDNPPEQSYFNLIYQDLTGSTTTVQFTAIIDYIVAFSEPKDHVQS